MVHSSQAGVHPRLGRVLARRRAARWRAGLHPPTVAAFDALQRLLDGERRPLVLDSGCGTGASTRRLALRHPDCLVVGVDRSAARLARLGAPAFPHREDNACWLRAELATFWRLALDAGWRLHRHYLLYPNPWPKPGQLQRRWHAHPVFPVLLGLGGRLEMRTNWSIYAAEFAQAAAWYTGRAVAPRGLAAGEPLSPFERKYRASGHPLYSVVIAASSSGV
jgi:tRNA G46 methylase TrmB